MTTFVSGTRPIESRPRTLADALADAGAGKFRKELHGHYPQTADQLAVGPGLARRITGDSLDFRANADRYECVGDQYLLDLPKV